MVRIAQFLYGVVFVVLLMGFSVPLASAQEEQGGLRQGQETCVGISEARSVLNQLVKDGAITQAERDEAAGGFMFNEDKVRSIQQAHAERWDEITTHYKNNPSVAGFVGRQLAEVFCWVGAPVNAVINEINNSPFWDDPIGKFTRSMMEGNSQMLASAMTLWMEFSTDSVDIAANTDGVKYISYAFVGFVWLINIMVVSFVVLVKKDGGLSSKFNDLSERWVEWVVYSTLVPAMFPMALHASDIVANEIMKDFGGMEAIVDLGGLENTEFGPVVTLLLTIVILAGTVVQVLALVTRIFLAPIVVGLTPLFAAMSFSNFGRQGLNHLGAWIIAAILFKPLSALLYVVALWNVGLTETDGISEGILNALIIGIAGFSGPALVRSFVPAVALAGGGGAGAALTTATGAIGAVSGMAVGALSRGGAALSAAGKPVGALNNTGKGLSGATGAVGSAGGGGRASSSVERTGAGGVAGRVQSGRVGGGVSPRSGARQRVMSAALRTTRGTGGAMSAASTGANALRGVANYTGRASAEAQSLFDDSIGRPGGYAGQAYR